MKTILAVPLTFLLLAPSVLAQTPTLPEGYELAVFHQEIGGPQLTGIAFSATGHAYVVNALGLIKRLEDTNGDLVADVVTQVWPALGFAPPVVGIVFLNGSLFVADRGSIWELRDTDNDLIFDTQLNVVTGLPVAFHQNNALFTDGTWLYFGQGSLTDHDIDAGPVSTLRKVMPDGTQLQVVADGIRNMFDGVVHPGGEIFVGDNAPNSLADPNPPDEFIRVVQGGHFGHPYNWGIPTSGPYLPPHLELPAHTAPTGLAVNHAQRTSGYQDEIYLASFAGGIVRIPVVYGALTNFPGSWIELFVGNLPQVIDIAIGPQDGDLYAVQYQPRTVVRIRQKHDTVLAITGQPSIGMVCPLEVRDLARAGNAFLVAASHQLAAPLILGSGVEIYLDVASPVFSLSITPGNPIFNFPVPGFLDAAGLGSASISIPNEPALLGFEIQLQVITLDGALAPAGSSPPVSLRLQIPY